MAGQWFLMGKEIDHRLKIYFRVNSSIDRVIYRLLLGMTFFLFYFNILSLLPIKWCYNTFWLTWAILGLFYSWPSRGKIIQESVSSNFSEYRFLDSFERTVLFLTGTIFILTFPEVPKLDTFDALKLYFDPNENISSFFWNFLSVNYLPFRKYPELFRLALSMHFYFVMIGLYLLTFYGLLRYFVGRRLSILGVFVIVSSWSFAKILANSFPNAIQSSLYIFYIWSAVWAIKSSTYRAGVFYGMVGFLLVAFDVRNLLGFSIGTLALVYFFLPDKTFWFKRQFLKYNLFGLTLILILLIFGDYKFSIESSSIKFIEDFKFILSRKAFLALCFFGVPIIFWKLFIKNKSIGLYQLQMDENKLMQFMSFWLITIITSVILKTSLVGTLALLLMMTFFALIPLELIFQTTTRLRSKRNMIYLLYIIICVLDSHFEGRLKNFIKFIDS